MPASQPASFNLQEFTDNGQLLVGGRLYTYAYGTTAQKTAYTDPNGTVPHTYTADGAGGQYIALNARGELPAPLYLVDGSYDLSLKRTDGSTVWTRKADGIESSIKSALSAFQLSDYAALRAYSGQQQNVFVTGYLGTAAPSGIAGVFVRDDHDTVSADNGATVFVDVLGRRWKRVYSDYINGAWFGVIANGIADDTDAMSAASAYASAVGMPLRITGTMLISQLAMTTPLEIVGKGKIIKKAGSLGHLITSSSDLIIRGDITLDQNAANNANGSATSSSDCTLFHTGASLVLDGITCLASVSANIRSSATSKLILNNCFVDGGWFCVLAPVGIGCVVSITGGKYTNSTGDDNIQISNTTAGFSISGVRSGGAYRSGIVINNSGGVGAITGCYCYNNRVDPVNQGGWGIVLSKSVARVAISGNVCVNNQRGPLTVDTYDPGATDAHVAITGNILDADYNGGYGTSGMVINGARYVSITGNRIRRALQGILVTFSNTLNITGNTIEDCGAGYFFQADDSTNVKFSGNICRLCTSAASAAVININRGTRVSINHNNIAELAGERHGFRISATTEFQLIGNVLHKADAGSGRCIFLPGTNTSGRIAHNRFYSAVAAFQYYIEATGTNTDIVTEKNEIAMPSIQTNPNRYILTGATLVADGDTINGVKDYYSAAPAFCTFRQGQTAGIAGVLKMWNGAAWV